VKENEKRIDSHAMHKKVSFYKTEKPLGAELRK